MARRHATCFLSAGAFCAAGAPSASCPELAAHRRDPARSSPHRPHAAPRRAGGRPGRPGGGDLLRRPRGRRGAGPRQDRRPLPPAGRGREGHGDLHRLRAGDVPALAAPDHPRGRRAARRRAHRQGRAGGAGRRRRRDDQRLPQPGRAHPQARHLGEGAGVDLHARVGRLGRARGADDADRRRARLAGGRRAARGPRASGASSWSPASRRACRRSSAPRSAPRSSPPRCSTATTSSPTPSSPRSSRASSRTRSSSRSSASRRSSPTRRTTPSSRRTCRSTRCSPSSWRCSPRCSSASSTASSAGRRVSRCRSGCARAIGGLALGVVCAPILWWFGRHMGLPGQGLGHPRRRLRRGADGHHRRLVAPRRLDGAWRSSSLLCARQARHLLADHRHGRKRRRLRAVAGARRPLRRRVRARDARSSSTIRASIRAPSRWWGWASSTAAWPTCR